MNENNGYNPEGNAGMNGDPYYPDQNAPQNYNQYTGQQNSAPNQGGQPQPYEQTYQQAQQYQQQFRQSQQKYDQYKQPSPYGGNQQYSTPVNASVMNQPAPAEPGRGLGIASMVLGIVSLVICCLYPFFVPSLPGLILGIVSVIRKPKGNGPGLAGLIMCGVTVLLGIIFWILLFVSPDFARQVNSYR